MRCAPPARRCALLTGSGPTAFGLFPALAAAQAGSGATRPRRRDRLRGGKRDGAAMRLPGEKGGDAQTARHRPRSQWPSPSATTCSAASSVTSTCSKLLEDISNTLGAWTYLLVGAFAFAETGAFVGLVVPGETVMLLGGAVAGQGAIDVYLLIAIAWFAAWAGDTTSFFIGRRLGRDFVLRHGPRFGIGHERFEQVEEYFSRHGGKTIFIGRFISLVRAFAPFIAGSSGMRYRAFVPYSILGTGLWASAHILVGYFFSRSIDTAAKYAGKGAFLLATLIVVVVGTVVLVRHFRVEENRRAAVRLDGSPRGDPLDGRPRPALPAPAPLPLEPGHAGRHLRAGVHLADGDARGRPLRPDRLRGGDRPRTRADAGRHDRDRTRRQPPHRLARPSVAKVFTALGSGVSPGALDRGLRRRSSPPAGAGPSSRS